MSVHLLKRTIFLVLVSHSVIGYLLWAKLCDTDASKVFQVGEFVLGAMACCLCSTAVLLGTAGFHQIQDEDDEALARAKLNSLSIVWSLTFFGGVLVFSFLKAH